MSYEVLVKFVVEADDSQEAAIKVIDVFEDLLPDPSNGLAAFEVLRTDEVLDTDNLIC